MVPNARGVFEGGGIVKTAWIFACLACVFFLLSLYFLDLLFFFFREKKRYEAASDVKAYVALLKQKQKKAKHPQKKNYYLYLVCLSLCKEESERAHRLLPFLKKDPILGVDPKSI
ncbi:MAG: hypothetical protein IJC26_03950 [Clostridia bacterium]|nr:hypothetical protein [Clostridia bacterium]